MSKELKFCYFILLLQITTIYITLHLFIVCARTHAYVCAMTGLWRSEVGVRGQLKVVCSFNVLCGSRDKIQVTGLGGKSL